MSELQDLRSPDFQVDTESGKFVGDYALVLMHGYGSNEHDLAQIGKLLSTSPNRSFTLPWASVRAPLEMAYGGAAWFPIGEPGNPQLEPVDEATAALTSWIDSNLSPHTAIVAAGFSQGGLMASQLLRAIPDRIAATVIFGGFVSSHPQAHDEALSVRKPPVFWGRGELDTVIAAPAIERTADWLPNHSTLTARTYPGLAHSINEQEIWDANAFIDAVLGQPRATTEQGPKISVRMEK